MPDVFRVRCRFGKTEIEVESSDRSYVEAKLEELLQRVQSSKGRGERAREASQAVPTAESPKLETGNVAVSEKHATQPRGDQPGGCTGKPGRKPDEAKRAKLAKRAKRAKKAGAKAGAKAPGKRRTPAPEQQATGDSSLGTDRLADAIRQQRGFKQAQKHILRQPGQLPRVLLCHYFADKLLDAGLTATQVEQITDQLGVRIASPNVAKVIRQNAKKYFSSERNDGVTTHRITRAGLAATERLLQGRE